jgi:DsbC/DsbD-like thiol-disulfide interchange protein
MRYAPLLALLIAGTGLAAPRAAAGEAIASPWTDFREAQVRLVAATPIRPGAPLSAGLEIRLAEGFKTYWRSPGDSGVPPVFDFTRSSGLEAVTVRFPMPETFDDGAGGRAWGYKSSVVLPIEARVTALSARLDLKLDFAVCGTMCIPLSGEIRLETASAGPAEAASAAALAFWRGRVPEPASAPAPTAARLAGDPPRYRILLPFPGDATELAVFAEANGFLETLAIRPAGSGLAEITLRGEPMPGTGRLGPVRLTYGDRHRAFERVIDLDGLAALP